jgi:hypothetical protein
MTIPNNPAGRLKVLFDVFHANDQPRPLTDWWNVVAGEIAPEGDAYSVRAEAGALLRDVEQAARALPPEDDPIALLAERPVWARSIFGWGLLDAPNQHETAASLIPRNAINALNGLAGVLRRDAPEFALVGDPAALVEDLDRVQKRLTELLLAVTADGDLPEASRRSIAQALVRAVDDLTYVRLRGLARLHHDVQTAHIESVAAVEAPAVQADAERLTRVRQWVGALLEVVVAVERLVVPTATTIAVAVTSGDLPTAIAAGVTARVALGAGASAAHRQLPPGGADTDELDDIPDQQGE